MDSLTITFALILLVASVVLVIEVKPYFSRQNHSHRNPDEDSERAAQREALKEWHRLRRQRDRVWLKVDELHDEFVQKTSDERPTIAPSKPDSPPRVSDIKGDTWN
jgi:hypothetical protein